MTKPYINIIYIVIIYINKYIYVYIYILVDKIIYYIYENLLS